MNTFEENTDKYVRVVLKAAHPKQLHCYKYTQHKDPTKAHFYLPIQEFSDITDRILSEDWNTEDVLVGNRYEIFLQVNVKVADEIVKVCYNNNKYRWVSVENWQKYTEFREALIEEATIKPYYYTDDYNQHKIAGQLRYLQIRVPQDMPDRISTAEPSYVQKPYSSTIESNYTTTEPSFMSLSTQLLGVVQAFGLTPKQAIQILLEEM